MLFASFLRWWYGPGWLDQTVLIRQRFSRTADLFSIGLSIRTFFKPFRQIDADGVRKGSLDVIMRSLFDQLFSRFFGAFARSVLILVGCCALVLEGFVAAIRLAFWPLMPVAPAVGLMLAVTGWVPWQ